MPNEIHS